MRQIKGIEVTLYNGEVVQDVLVGNPATAGIVPLSDAGGRMIMHTLAIPKGDTHAWTDTILSFWGRTYRTVGAPLQGIEENIPTRWHKQVNVEILPVNSGITVYDGDYTAHYFPMCHIHDARQTVTTKTGRKPSGELYATIYAFAGNDSYIPKVGDIIVAGECDFVFDTATEQSISQSMQAFRASRFAHETAQFAFGKRASRFAHETAQFAFGKRASRFAHETAQYAAVQTVSLETYGTLPDINLTAR